MGALIFRWFGREPLKRTEEKCNNLLEILKDN